MIRVPIPSRHQAEVVLALAHITRFAFRPYLFELRHHTYRVRTDGRGELIVEITNKCHARKAIWKLTDRNGLAFYTEVDAEEMRWLPIQKRQALSTYHWVQKLVYCSKLVKKAQKYK